MRSMWVLVIQGGEVGCFLPTVGYPNFSHRDCSLGSGQCLHGAEGGREVLQGTSWGAMEKWKQSRGLGSLYSGSGFGLLALQMMVLSTHL